tara:strand:+ start:308 stop:1042 length:735 start_codon:yes stop_codon:yes gene_type:complete
MALLNKKETNGTKVKKKGKSQSTRRDEIMQAINQVVENDDTKNPEALQHLLISTAFLENSLGANDEAYNRGYTNSQWSIDEGFLNDILEKSGYVTDYDAETNTTTKTDRLKKNNYNKFLIRAGYDPGDPESMKQFVEDLKNDNALTGAYMARLKYSLNPNAPLPELTKESVFKSWYADYNSGGIKEGSEEFEKITKNFNTFYDEFFKEEEEEDVPSETEDDGGTGMVPKFMDKGNDIFSPESLI